MFIANLSAILQRIQSTADSSSFSLPPTFSFEVIRHYLARSSEGKEGRSVSIQANSQIFNLEESHMESGATIPNANQLLVDKDVSPSIDFDICHRRVEELAKLQGQLNEFRVEAMATAKLEMFDDSYLSRLKKMISEMQLEYIALVGMEDCLEYNGIDNPDMQLESLKTELTHVQADSIRASQEIENLAAKVAKDANYLEDELLNLETYLKFLDGQKKANDENDQSDLIDQLEKELEHLKMEEANWDDNKRHESCMLIGENCKYKELRLEDQLSQRREDWRELQKLDDMFKRIEAAIMFEDLLCQMKDISFTDGCIKLSLKTCIPAMGGSICQFGIKCITETSTVEHGLIIKVMTETMALQAAELIPNDVPIDDIVHAAKAIRDSMTRITLLELRSQLAYLVGQIQFRIYCYSIRSAVLKDDAKASRNSFQYSERDQVIIVHVFGGIKAFIKVPQNWPVSISPLKLLSLKPLDETSGDISLGMLCKAMDLLNSLELSRRQNLLLFIDAIEEILLQEMPKGASFKRTLQ